MFSGEKIPVLPSVLFSRVLSVVLLEYVFVGKHFSLRYILFDLVFDADLDFDIENLFRILFFMQMVEVVSETNRKENLLSDNCEKFQVRTNFKSF